MSLAGKCIVISGAASGIGQGVARHLATLGAHLSLADINLEGLTAEAEQIRAAGNACLVHRVDVRKRADIDAWIRSTVDTFGRLDGAVNCAGVQFFESLQMSYPSHPFRPGKPSTDTSRLVRGHISRANSTPSLDQDTTVYV
ncbi:uncharacterized protein N0V89_008078 [Didymosphaeria variabile]|uniref:NAD(P)-binding protein n=1 Tax=Didymosphaeria variabile TaxID=1932322 RepID=A0A9W9C8I3_9PLEO|nr:uncharacterized protein N0V89_008078 [Didymosphaeria variabile]KAJ4349463.1 hypothetical protein N0V89_008078 [Didymosphaeria variabile]